MGKLSIAVHTEDHMQGDAAAECILVEYGDYECPHCGRAHAVVKKLQQHFGKRLSLVFRNFPLSQMHPWAEPAAEAAEFAGDHEKFWPMHDLLFENQEQLGNDLFIQLAEQLHLSASELQTAMEEQTYRGRIRADFSGGVRSGVNGTPTFFINGERYNGSYDFDSLRHAIDEALQLNPAAPAK